MVGIACPNLKIGCSNSDSTRLRARRRGHAARLHDRSRPAKPRSPTWEQPGYRSARSETTRAARFSWKSGTRCSASGNAHRPTFARGSKCQTRADIVTRQLRKISQNLLLTHAGGKVGEHVTDGNARPPHAWLPEPYFGFYDDPILIIHRCENRQMTRGRQHTERTGRPAPPSRSSRRAGKCSIVNRRTL
jgi:hypothetical protein